MAESCDSVLIVGESHPSDGVYQWEAPETDVSADLMSKPVAGRILVLEVADNRFAASGEASSVASDMAEKSVG